MKSIVLSNYPGARPRRNRRDEASRRLSRETTLSTNDLIYPVFVREGQGVREAIEPLPGQYRYSPDTVLHAAEACMKLGVPVLSLFPYIDPLLKTPDGREACNPDGLIPRVVRAVKQEFPELGILTDVALDPYTSHGQDGVIDEKGYVINDVTVDILAEQALVQASAGTDWCAPSDMMDGRVAAIRHALESNGFIHTKIMAYSAKYASAFYGPFRSAVGSAANLGKSDKMSYQLDPANRLEGIREAAYDLQEGADSVMVKPGMPYLDVLRDIKAQLGVPTYVYQVSGEYAMLQAAALNGWLDGPKIMMESLLAFKRAGADGILTYYALEAAAWLQQNGRGSI